MIEKRVSAFDIFNRIYEDNLRASKTNEEAYDKAEQSFRATFGITQYSGYDSFRTVRSRRLKRKNHKDRDFV